MLDRKSERVFFGMLWLFSFVCSLGCVMSFSRCQSALYLLWGSMLPMLPIAGTGESGSIA